MKQFLNARIIAAVAALAVGAACSKNPDPVPLPPPAPSAPNSPYGGGGFVGAGACGPVGGEFPLRRDNSPYYGNLYSDYTGGTSNSLSVTLSYVNYSYAENQLYNIVGGGQFNLPDLQVFSGGYGQPIPQTTFCVSSANPQGGGITPGVFDSASKGLAIVLRGVVQMPMYSPYGGYGTPQVPYGQELVEVSVGNAYGCDAWLAEGRINGCVQVKLGNSQPIYYQAY